MRACSDHPDLWASLNNLASLYQAEGRTSDALPLVERTIASGNAQLRVAHPMLSAAPRQQLLPAERALDDALNAVQRGAQSSAASAVNKLAVRLAAGNDRLAQLVRRNQDLATEAETLDKTIVAAVSKEPSKRNAVAERRSKDRLAAIVAERATLLTALPFHLLVTERSAAAIPEKIEGYRDAAWLLKRQAVSVLPSVARLKALRRFARKDQGTKPMIGFGDPLFDLMQDGTGDRRAAAGSGTTESAARGLTTAAYTDFWQGAGVDRVRLAQALPRLPDTADELNGRAGPRCCRVRHSSRRGCQRNHGQARAARRLRHRLFCHPWSRCRRREGPRRTLAGAEHSKTAVRTRRRSARPPAKSRS